MEDTTCTYCTTIPRGRDITWYRITIRPGYSFRVSETQVKATREEQRKEQCHTGMCAFEFYNATNIFLKSTHKVYPGEIQNVSTAVFSHKLKKKQMKNKQNSPRLASMMFTIAFIAAVLTRGSWSMK